MNSLYESKQGWQKKCKAKPVKSEGHSNEHKQIKSDFMYKETKTRIRCTSRFMLDLGLLRKKVVGVLFPISSPCGEL